MSHPSTLGSLIPLDADARRDAIHIATVPLIASPDTYLHPGQPFKLDDTGRAVVVANAQDALGVVDPFLKTSVRPGERFWGCVTPGAVTGLRHEWDHHVISPAGVVRAAVVERVVEKPEDPEVAAVREFAKSHGLTLEGVIDEARTSLGDSCRGCH